jgi:hypothetical protein
MFRFTIRDVLWLVTVIAVAACWFGDRHRIVKTLQAKANAERRDLLIQERRLQDYLEAALTENAVLKGHIAPVASSKPDSN